MIDISTPLQRFSRAARDWSQQQSRDLLDAIGTLLGGRVDWDAGAGEDWGRVLGQHGVDAFVSMRGPMVIVRKRDIVEIGQLLNVDAIVIEVPAMDEPVLSASRDVLTDTFGDRAESSALASEGFSANDLWFATV